MVAADFWVSSFSNDAFHLAMIVLIGLIFGLWSVLMINCE